MGWGWGVKEAGSSSFSEFLEKRRAILHNHPQLSKAVNHQPLCSHKNSTKICEHRKHSSVREKVQDRHKVHQISTGHTKSHGKEDTERLYQLEIAERSSRMGQMDQTEMQLNHNTQIFGNGCTLKDTP